MRRLLDAVYFLLLLVTLPYWLWKAATVGKYRHGIAERFFGSAPTLRGSGPRLWVHAVSVGLQDPEEFLYAKFAAIVPSLSREVVSNLNREDGRALAAEVNARFNGRPEAKEIPFGNSSSPDSPAEPPTTPTP